MISGEKNNICVVGDDDQGMYRFRGATIRNNLEFPDKLSEDECNIINLNKNYRSEEDIIDFYNAWMSDTEEVNLFNCDKFRYQKNIVAAKERTSKEKFVYKCSGNSIDDEKNSLTSLSYSIGHIRGIMKGLNIPIWNEKI